MARRYLSLTEAAGALRRGKSLECFLGRCERSGEPGIRWLSICSEGEGTVIRIYESADVGNAEFLDVYAFGPLNGELESDGADDQISTSSTEDCWTILEQKFPDSTARLVTQGMIQDEYADFVATRSGS